MNTESGFTVKPIAIVQNSRTEPTDDFWGDIISIIELHESIPVESLTGLNQFSHLEILFYFNKAEDKNISFTGYPRNNPLFPLAGIFATHKKDRPNHLGHTVAGLIRIEGRKIFVRDLDAIDGTPILDIKPVIKEFLPQIEKVSQPQWATDIMKNYWKNKQVNEVIVF